MKRYFLLIIGIFLFTGCDVTYNLELDYPIKEKAIIIENNQANWDVSIDNMTYRDFIDYAADHPFPLLNSDSEYGQVDKKVKGVSYYDVSKLSNSTQLGLLINGKFTKQFDESNMVWYGLTTFEFKDNDNSIYLYGDGFKIFEMYNTLDNITVNIKTDYEVKKNNADKIVDNVYTWNINRSNYNTKSIYIETDKFATDKVKIVVVDGIESFSNKGTILALLLLIAGLVAICFYYKKRVNSKF